MTASPDARPDLPPQYTPAEVEEPLYRRWEERGYFTADPTSAKPPFSIVIPPPNVTGNLHLGHALEQSMMDALTRRARMRGFDALWLPGMDHASIAVQNLVERHLAETEGKSRFDYTREQFIGKAWEWKERFGGQILGQMRRLGDGVDWSRERFTMDEGLSEAVQTIFKKLYDADLIYRAERIINWCPRDLTALSDIEVEHDEEIGELVSIRYGDGDASIVVATTRAETMLGDTAVAVHPDDVRYQHLIGTQITLPLTNRTIPIVADEHVDPSFGTGAVKVTPAHDPNDFEIGRRHDLPMLTIMDERAVITAPGPFKGLDRMEARFAIVAALREDGRIVDLKRPYMHAVGHCHRCDTIIEPRLSLQWWVRVETLAREAGNAVRDGRVVIEPASLAPRYFQWVDGLRDWCISRQLWWGHRIPVWYSPDGDDHCFGPGEKPPAGWTQDPDVLDTWFSSALWPFSTMGWPHDTEDLRRYYPGTVLVTGYDILFFWVVRMMLFGLYAMDGQPPFKTVLLHGLVRDSSGKKMSKSRGNVIDPLLWIDAYGADAVRLSLLQGANPGADQAINEEWVVGARNFCTKLWNATRFAMLNGATVVRSAARRRVGRGRVDPVAAAGGDHRGRRAVRAVRVRQDRRRALPLRVGRGLRLVPGTGEDLAGRAVRGRDSAGARRGARRAAAPSAPDDPVRHRGAVDRAHRGRVGGDRGLADGRSGSVGRRRDRRDRRRAGRRDRGAAVPLRPGGQAVPARARAGERCRFRGAVDPCAAAPGRAGRRVLGRPPR